jgi:hypothetical protein
MKRKIGEDQDADNDVMHENPEKDYNANSGPAHVIPPCAAPPIHIAISDEYGLPIFPLFRLCIDRIIFYTKSDIS